MPAAGSSGSLTSDSSEFPLIWRSETRLIASPGASSWISSSPFPTMSAISS